MPNSTFNLRLWFAIGSFGTIMLICIAAAFWVSSFLTETLLQREAEVSQQFLESIVKVNGPAMFHDDGAPVPNQSPELIDFAQHMLSIPGIKRINIHTTTRRILWSTEPQIVGKTFTGNPELEEAFKGDLVTEVSALSGDTKPEHIALGDTGALIESYMPLRADMGQGPIVGVVEFYKLPLKLETMVLSAQRVVWTSAIISATLLFIVLYWIVQRGALTIERQQAHMGRMEAFAAIGQMSSAVAHSLRNPMSAIRSSAELWRSEVPPEERGVADEVIGEVDRMDGYVRDLLAYAKSEPYQLHPVEPANVIDAILSKHQRAVERNQIAVEFYDDRTSDLQVMADERLLEQALTSVVTNSIEAMPSGGTLAVSIGPGDDKDRLRIDIADSGRGIPPELMDRVAQSYFTTKARGLGLGLVLAKGIIERFGGKVDLVSTRDVGTLVSIHLRVA